jgi:hypothetical protein
VGRATLKLGRWHGGPNSDDWTETLLLYIVILLRFKRFIGERAIPFLVFKMFNNVLLERPFKEMFGL